MAKKKKEQDQPPDLAESLKTAFERTVQAYTEGTHSTGERTRAVLDEMAAAGARIRQTLLEARAADEIAGLRREVEALSRRVAVLEAAAQPKPATTARRTGASTRKPAASSSARKPAASRSTSSPKPGTD